jgi:hypothetical protein
MPALMLRSLTSTTLNLVVLPTRALRYGRFEGFPKTNMPIIAMVTAMSRNTR